MKFYELFWVGFYGFSVSVFEESRLYEFRELGLSGLQVRSLGFQGFGRLGFQSFRFRVSGLQGPGPRVQGSRVRGCRAQAPAT